LATERGLSRFVVGLLFELVVFGGWGRVFMSDVDVEAPPGRLYGGIGNDYGGT